MHNASDVESTSTKQLQAELCFLKMYVEILSPVTCKGDLMWRLPAITTNGEARKDST